MGRPGKLGIRNGLKNSSQMSLANSTADSVSKELANKIKEKTENLQISQTGKNLLNQAKDDKTKNLIMQLYRPGAKIGDGGTADALRYEKKTGKLVGNKGHEIKAIERANQIKNMFSKNPNHPDKIILKKLLNNLEDALNGGDKK